MSTTDESISDYSQRKRAELLAATDGTPVGFYVELARDKYGNTGKHKAVVEAKVTPDGRDLLPLAPAVFAEKWPTGWLRGGWQETEGPARMLTDEEWAALTGWENRR